MIVIFLHILFEVLSTNKKIFEYLYSNINLNNVPYFYLRHVDVSLNR